jgi:NADH-quinone oxidoreductase subunit N
MLSSILAAASDFVSPKVDYHALAPEIVLAVGICVVLLVDLFVPEHRRWITGTVSGFFLLGAVLPLVTLAVKGADVRDALGDGRYIIDNFSLVLKALFLLSAYVVVLLSSREMEDGGYHQGEYYVLLLSSVLGMVMISSARDLVSLFVALEFLSIPAYMLAAWRKRDRKSNEAGVKYYLLGVFASAVLLYGMSLLYGLANSTRFSDIAKVITLQGGKVGVQVVAVAFVLIGFAFKISAVPFHTWAPDTYEGAPTPVTAFLSVASKAAGFVGLIALVFLTFPQANDVYRPFLWVMAALTMTVGNLVALKQTNIVRMLAYSSISQGGFILMPIAMAGTGSAASSSLRAVMVYVIIYAATNLGALR